ncbi:glycosyltransferase [Thalassotalea sp. 1_MG-2023]|uniref:glycosyltransferase n=1 Tax=Thalassotalea sp. 1_MG-2023 TaxID=3062680 RepID=UPI0026E474DD|nr:glycosyltransferase [Thalassotalea sp. 1_MG-2023]MDO6426513.1 glycosyltransferase [Thalassotalea sp. 1_MG-2023]
MANNKLVTVYIATHNRIDLLLRAVDSVFNQSYSNIELIIADDGSTDETYERLQPYIDNEQIVYVKSEVPKGACAARNLAIQIAKGYYITGMDDDDVMTSNRVSHLVSEFEKGCFSCIASSITERTPQGDITRTSGAGVISLDKLLHHNLLGNQVLTKTDYLKQINGFDPNMPAFQDYDTWVRLVQRFGLAYKSSIASYIWFTDHNLGRISESPIRRVNAFNLFYQKHSYLMNKDHKASMEILRKKLTKEHFGAVDFVRLTNRQNIKYSLSLFINLNFKPFKYLLDWFRVKFFKK